MNTHPLHVNYKVIYLRDWIEEIKEFYRRKNTKLTSDEMVEGVFEDTFYLIRRIQETIGNNSQTKNILKGLLHRPFMWVLKSCAGHLLFITGLNCSHLKRLV